MRIVIGFFIAVLIAGAVSAEPQSDVLLKARVLQLERQLVACGVQIASAQQTQQQAELEKEAGCVIDWNVVPPVCKASKP